MDFEEERLASAQALSWEIAWWTWDIARKPQGLGQSKWEDAGEEVREEWAVHARPCKPL